MLNTFEDYCKTRGIRDPFIERQRLIYDDSVPEEEKAEEYRRLGRQQEEYLRLMHTFRLWAYHFWMPREEFIKHAKLSKDYADIDIYLPCDCADRQCTMTCAYFGGECPRMKEELKIPESLGFEGRWEFHDDYDC